MEQLLQITRIPIRYEMKITNARLEQHHGSASVQIHRQKGGLQIQNRPSRLHMDTYDARNSIVPTTKTSIYQAAVRGQQRAASVTARYAREGRILMEAQPMDGGQTIKQIMAERMEPATGDFQLAFLPTAPVNISASEPSLMMNYQMDKLYFDWRIDNGDVEFIPGDVEISITQYLDVQIEYVGDPMYVPPSVAEQFGAEIGTES